MQAVASVAEAQEIALASGAEELCVIGGAEIYALALSLAGTIHLTHVDTMVEDADAFFPSFGADDWKPARRESHPADAKHPFAFEFVDYVRR